MAVENLKELRKAIGFELSRLDIGEGTKIPIFNAISAFETGIKERIEHLRASANEYTTKNIEFATRLDVRVLELRRVLGEE